MRGFSTLLLIAGLATGVMAGEPLRFITYRDGIGLQADIPAGSKQQSDGTFALNYGGAVTHFELMFSTPHVFDNKVDCNGKPASYRVSKSNLFAYSCQIGPNIRYHIEKYGRTYRVGDSNATETIEYTINYPAAQRAFWDPVAARMSKSLRFAR